MYSQGSRCRWAWISRKYVGIALLEFVKIKFSFVCIYTSSLRLPFFFLSFTVQGISSLRIWILNINCKVMSFFSPKQERESCLETQPVVLTAAHGFCHIIRNQTIHQNSCRLRLEESKDGILMKGEIWRDWGPTLCISLYLKHSHCKQLLNVFLLFKINMKK